VSVKIQGKKQLFLERLESAAGAAAGGWRPGKAISGSGRLPRFRNKQLFLNIYRLRASAQGLCVKKLIFY